MGALGVAPVGAASILMRRVWREVDIPFCEIFAAAFTVHEDTHEVMVYAVPRGGADWLGAETEMGHAASGVERACSADI